MTFSAAVLDKGGKWLAPCPRRGVAFDRDHAEVHNQIVLVLEARWHQLDRVCVSASFKILIDNSTKNGRLSAGLPSDLRRKIRAEGRFLVPLQLAPAVQIECRLIFLSWKLDCQRHRQRYMDRGSSLDRLISKRGVVCPS